MVPILMAVVIAVPQSPLLPLGLRLNNGAPLQALLTFGSLASSITPFSSSFFISFDTFFTPFISLITASLQLTFERLRVRAWLVNNRGVFPADLGHALSLMGCSLSGGPQYLLAFSCCLNSARKP